MNQSNDNESNVCELTGDFARLQKMLFDVGARMGLETDGAFLPLGFVIMKDGTEKVLEGFTGSENSSDDVIRRLTSGLQSVYLSGQLRASGIIEMVKTSNPNFPDKIRALRSWLQLYGAETNEVFYYIPYTKDAASIRYGRPFLKQSGKEDVRDRIILQ